MRISVVIRTVGRPSIEQSLLSLAAQRRPPVEVVIVRARPDALPALPAMGAIDVRVVGGGVLNCPQAANAGLDAARGSHVIYLDDDDTFDPGHLASLAAALEADPAARVAYSATLGLDNDGRPVGDLDYPFDRLFLFKRNYIQMGAALFERSLAIDGCRFDETLEAFEDWDFWLQAAMRTHFAYTGLKTNRWSVFSGGSGTGAVDAARDERLRRFQAQLNAKWAGEQARLAQRLRYLEGKAGDNRVAIQRLRGGPIARGSGIG
jgi:hypothetical protein